MLQQSLATRRSHRHPLSYSLFPPAGPVLRPSERTSFPEDHEAIDWMRGSSDSDSVPLRLADESQAGGRSVVCPVLVITGPPRCGKTSMVIACMNYVERHNLVGRAWVGAMGIGYSPDLVHEKIVFELALKLNLMDGLSQSLRHLERAWGRVLKKLAQDGYWTVILAIDEFNNWIGAAGFGATATDEQRRDFFLMLEQLRSVSEVRFVAVGPSIRITPAKVVKSAPDVDNNRAWIQTLGRYRVDRLISVGEWSDPEFLTRHLLRSFDREGIRVDDVMALSEHLGKRDLNGQQVAKVCLLMSNELRKRFPSGEEAIPTEIALQVLEEQIMRDTARRPA